MRLLAAVTLLEAAMGLGTIDFSLRLPLLLSHPPPGRVPPFLAAELARLTSFGSSSGYVVQALDVTFSVLLLGCAVLLWRENRWGMTGVIGVLLAELAGVIAAALVRFPLFDIPGLAPGLGAQFETVYPLVAAALLTLAYRYRRLARAG